jgi:hypothetical protein
VAVKRCAYCGGYVQWLRLAGGDRLPFNYDLTPVEELEPGQGWLISRIVKGGYPRAVAVRLEHCGAAKQAAARRALTVHACPEYLAARENDEAPSGANVR